MLHSQYSREEIEKLSTIVISCAAQKKKFSVFSEQEAKQFFYNKIDEALSLYRNISSCYSVLTQTLQFLRTATSPDYMWEECWLKLNDAITDDDNILKKDDFVKQELRFLRLLVELVDYRVKDEFHQLKKFYRFKVNVDAEGNNYYHTFALKKDFSADISKICGLMHKLDSLNRLPGLAYSEEFSEKYTKIVNAVYVYFFMSENMNSQFLDIMKKNDLQLREYYPIAAELLTLEKRLAEIEEECKSLLKKFSPKKQTKKSRRKNATKNNSGRTSKQHENFVNDSVSNSDVLNVDTPHLFEEPTLTPSILEETQYERSLQSEIPNILESDLSQMSISSLADSEMIEKLQPKLSESNLALLDEQSDRKSINPLYQTYQKKEDKNENFVFKSRSRKTIEKIFDGDKKIKYADLVTLVEHAFSGKELSKTGSSSRKLILGIETIFLHQRHNRDRKDYVDPNTIKDVKRVLGILGVTPETIDCMRASMTDSTTRDNDSCRKEKFIKNR